MSAALRLMTRSEQRSIPRVFFGGRQSKDVAQDIVDALIAHNDPVKLYVLGDSLVYVSWFSGTARIKRHTPQSLRVAVGKVANIYKVDRAGAVEASTLPLQYVSHVLEDTTLWSGLPKLVGLTQTPLVAAHGEVEHTIGYMPASGMYFAPPEGEAFAVENIDGTLKNVEKAKTELYEYLLSGFPFVDNASRANALALALQPIVRTLITGPTPLFLIDAPVHGAGKTKLAETLAAISNPAIDTRAAPQNDSEWRKSITSFLKVGKSHFLVDNLAGKVDSPALCIALTSTAWSDRLLGGNTDLTLINEATWIATGNNAILHEDVATRCVYIRLDPDCARPELRDDFLCADPPTEVRRRRGHYLGLLLCLVRHWIDKGMPRYAGAARSRYPEWLAIMGGILESVGVEGIVGNYIERTKNVSREQEDWDDFVAAWAEAYGEAPVRISELLHAAFGGWDNALGKPVGGPLLNAIENLTARNQAQKLGKALQSRLDRVYSGHKIKSGKKRDGYPTYLLERIK